MTRASVLALLSYHPLTTALPQLPADMRIRTAERVLTLSELFAASAAGTLREVFCVGTAAAVTFAARIGWQLPRPDASASTETKVVEIVLPPRRVGQEASRWNYGSASWTFRRGVSSGGGVGCPKPLILDAGACKWTVPVT